MNSVELMPMLADEIQRVSLDESERITFARLDIDADNIEARSNVSSGSTALTTKKVQKPRPRHISGPTRRR